MARTFGGVSTDRIAVTNYTAINDLSTLTYAAWTYRTGDGANSLGRIIDKANAAGAGTGGAVLTNNNNPGTNNRCDFYAFRWGTTVGQWSFPRPAANEWHHIAVTYGHTATTEAPVAYLDGVSQTVTLLLAPAGTLGTETQTLHVGNRGAADRNWAGRLGECAVWNRVLNAGEVKALAKGRSPLALGKGLVLYLPIIGKLSPEQNFVAGNTGTVTGTVTVDHPPAVMPPFAWVGNGRGVFVPAAGVVLFEGFRRNVGRMMR